MKVKISFKHLKHSEALNERIHEKSEKLEKYFQGNTSATWHCWVHGDEHWAELKVHGPKFDFFAKGSADNMYKALDLAVDKMEKQIEKQKDMRRNKIHHSSHESLKYKEIQKLIAEEDKVYYQDLEEKSA